MKQLYLPIILAANSVSRLCSISVCGLRLPAPRPRQAGISDFSVRATFRRRLRLESGMPGPKDHPMLVRLALLVAALLWAPPLAAQAPATNASFNALIFFKSVGFKHDSIPAGVEAVQKLAAAHPFKADFTEDAATFTSTNLARYQVVVFLNNCGDLFNEEQRAAFQGYMRAGGGFAGIHCPIDCEKSWPWFSQLLGTRFLTHPAVMPGTIVVED
ncbi:MAG: ThuA domain-containing protein, partial [Chloroflexi bacterium]|nr:ThuA domain-containing protein [Chloroflexota bacterium]